MTAHRIIWTAVWVSLGVIWVSSCSQKVGNQGIEAVVNPSLQWGSRSKSEVCPSSQTQLACHHAWTPPITQLKHFFLPPMHRLYYAHLLLYP